MNKPITQLTALTSILNELKDRQRGVELNRKAFRQELERLLLECNDLVKRGFVHSSYEIQNNMKCREITELHMDKMDCEIEALGTAIEAIHRMEPTLKN